MAKDNGKMSKAAIAAGAATAAAAVAAGYYFYASKDAKQNRKVAAKWATDMKREVVAQAKKAQKIDRATMLRMVDQTAKAYHAARSLDRSEVQKAVRELKSNWEKLALESGKKMGSAKKAVKKAVRKATKKTR